LIKLPEQMSVVDKFDEVLESTYAAPLCSTKDVAPDKEELGQLSGAE